MHQIHKDLFLITGVSKFQNDEANLVDDEDNFQFITSAANSPILFQRRVNVVAQKRSQRKGKLFK